ncbi:MAG: hypothetical protein ACTSQA_01180 [Candidatus Heimdallarchaeaceae archaeon]
MLILNNDRHGNLEISQFRDADGITLNRLYVLINDGRLAGFTLDKKQTEEMIAYLTARLKEFGK